MLPYYASLREIMVNFLLPKQNKVNMSYNFEILDSITESMAVINIHGEIIFTNKAWGAFSEENDGDDSCTGTDNNYIAVCETVTGDELKMARDAKVGIQNVIDKKLKIFELEYPCHSPTKNRWFILRVSPVLSNPEFTLLAHINITNRKLAELEIQRKNKDIKDSINYSEKIQRSILPPMAEIQQQIPNAFVYFEPKDIIGGDFYWYFTRGKKCYIAAIDCTGHGVPGALMSMTIYSLLNEIMIKEELTDPGEILSLLHKKLSLAMQQQKGDEYSQDGCDATLVRIDLNTKELVFSGAQNDLLIYNGSELKTLQAERQSIGGFSMLGEFESERVFTSQTITISNTDLIILTTDGIPDQLNINDEAFGIRQFKGVIEGMYDKNSDDMKTSIESGINAWKKDVQQQDDLLIFGFKLN